MSRTIQPPTMHTKLVAASVSDMVQEWYQGKCEVPPMQVDTFEQRISRFQSDLTPPAADYVAGPAFCVIDPHWGEPEIMMHTIRPTEEAAIEAALNDPDLAMYSGASFVCTPPIKGKWQSLVKQGYRIAPVALAARPASPDTRVDVEALAAVLWREQAVGTGAPHSVASGRTAEAFADQSAEIRATWLKFAACAIRHIGGQDRG